MVSSPTKVIDFFLREDIGAGDATALLTPNIRVEAAIYSNSQGILAGYSEVSTLLEDRGVKATFNVCDGDTINEGLIVATLKGHARSILSLERTVLNMLSRMSGVATLTRKYVNVVSSINPRVRIAATRKTSPGFRLFDKKAVVVGGGVSHRMGLYDMILIKDNHLFIFGGDIEKAVSTAREKNKKLKIEVEVSEIVDAITAAECGADMILLDNMSPKKVKKTIESLKEKNMRQRVLLEASGGITLSNVREYAKTGVDWISIGELTTSPKGMDFNLEFIKKNVVPNSLFFYLAAFFSLFIIAFPIPFSSVFSTSIMSVFFSSSSLRFL
jgi:nicotinate-nucleotide pyrophosphorylase (carboxylating)